LRLFNTPRAPHRGQTGIAAPWVVVVCLLVLALLTAVQVGHVHINEADSDHCTLCILLQTAAPVAITAAVIILVMVGSRTPLVEQVVVVRTRCTRIFIRPPPRGY
jgi:hypothetical protein